MPLNPKILIPLIVIAVIAYSSIFTVNQWEQALVFKFREIQRSDDEPGLHFMLPLVNVAQKFEKRLLILRNFLPIFVNRFFWGSVFLSNRRTSTCADRRRE